MPLTDKAGHLWAHRSTVKAGDVLITDGGFTCMGNHERKVVKSFEGPLLHCDAEYAKDPFARLYIDCSDGTHGLDGQVGEDGELIGLYAASVPTSNESIG
jgi:hypothetical protein